jgi:hypothetical protein
MENTAAGRIRPVGVFGWPRALFMGKREGFVEFISKALVRSPKISLLADTLRQYLSLVLVSPVLVLVLVLSPKS